MVVKSLQIRPADTMPHRSAIAEMPSSKVRYFLCAGIRGPGGVTSPPRFLNAASSIAIPWKTSFTSSLPIGGTYRWFRPPGGGTIPTPLVV